MKSKLTRRTFIKRTGAAAAAASLVAPAWGAAAGANDDIRIAIVGLHGHGTGAHLNRYLPMPGVRVVALCDPDRHVLDDRANRVRQTNPAVRAYTDIRKMLDDGEIDAISGATPNHWHALSTVLGCQAGVHVCVEKPVSHNIWEGRKMVEAATKYKRLVQADLDLRSNLAYVRAIEFLRSGKLGKIEYVHCWIYKRRGSIGQVDGAGVVPDWIDYDLWCGPAPKVPLPRRNLHYDWHWQWDYGCGEIGNNGPHFLDVCRWALGESGLPSSVLSFGGRYGYKDDGQTPNTHLALFEYPTAPILFEVRGLPCSPSDGRMDSFRAKTRGGRSLYHAHDSSSPNCGAMVVCEGGAIDFEAKKAIDREGNTIESFGGEAVQSAANFIRALRSGKESDLRVPILEGHLSTSICHMGNISYRVGSEASVEEAEDVIRRDEQALDALERTREHLSANGIDLADESLTLGPRLTMDSKTERFTGQFADAANRLVKREYREPFVIRDEV